MEKAPEEQYLTHTPPFEDIGRQKIPQFKGIRLRKWGSWGSEIRMPKTRAKIWLGSYKTAEQAARAYDAAVYCLRGPNANFNFPYSVPSIPSASTLSREQIQVAAAKYALDEFPSTSLSLRNTKNMNNKAREKSISLSRPSPMELSCNSQQIHEAQDWKLWDYPFDGNDGLDLEKIPSIDEVSASQLEEQQQGYFSFDTADLWNV